MRNKTLQWLTLAILPVWLGVPFSGCTKKPESASAPPPEVEVVAIEQKDVPIYREWVGTVEPEINASISAQVTGYLLTRNYTEGKAVTNGQVLFQIEKAPFEAALERAQAQLEQAIAQRDKLALDVERYRPLAEKEAISKQELDNAVQNEKTAAAQVAAARAAVEEARLNLGFTTIRSPIDGIAGLAKTQIGDLIGPSSGQLTTVTKVEPARVYFSVSQQLLSKIQEQNLAEGKPTVRTGDGPELEVFLASGTLYPLKGRVRFADNQVDVKTGTLTVVGEFPNPQMLLVPGMFVRVRALLSTEHGALLVPQRAVIDVQGHSLVAVVGEDNLVSVIPVKTGEQVGGQYVISGKVRAGQRVVAEGMQKVRPGAAVTPVPFVQKTVLANPVGPKTSPP